MTQAGSVRQSTGGREAKPARSCAVTATTWRCRSSRRWSAEASTSRATCWSSVSTTSRRRERCPRALSSVAVVVEQMGEALAAGVRGHDQGARLARPCTRRRSSASCAATRRIGRLSPLALDTSKCPRLTVLTRISRALAQSEGDNMSQQMGVVNRRRGRRRGASPPCWCRRAGGRMRDPTTTRPAQSVAPSVLGFDGHARPLDRRPSTAPPATDAALRPSRRPAWPVGRRPGVAAG